MSTQCWEDVQQKNTWLFDNNKFETWPWRCLPLYFSKIIKSSMEMLTFQLCSLRAQHQMKQNRGFQLRSQKTILTFHLLLC